MGWNKAYAEVARAIEHYQVIVPYLLAVNVILFLVITILMFARGSGLEQWLLYYLVAAPVLWLVSIVQRRQASDARPTLLTVSRSGMPQRGPA